MKKIIAFPCIDLHLVSTSEMKICKFNVVTSITNQEIMCSEITYCMLRTQVE